MNVRTTLLALKLYIVALALGLFVFGWALIARRDAARVAAQDPATPQIIVVQKWFEELKQRVPIR